MNFVPSLIDYLFILFRLSAIYLYICLIIGNESMSNLKSSSVYGLSLLVARIYIIHD